MVREAFRSGWQKFKENWKLLVGVQVVTLVLSAVFNLLADNLPEELWAVALGVYLLTVVWGIVIGIGTMKIYLKVFDGEPASLKDLIAHYRLFFKLILAQLVSGLVSLAAVLPLVGAVVLLAALNNTAAWIIGSVMILIGVLLVVHVGIRLMFVQYLVVDKGLGPIEVVKGSFAITKGHVLKLLWFGAVSFLVAILGVLALFVGLFAAIPVISLATVSIYRELSK
jgi:hypothetical protein